MTPLERKRIKVDAVFDLETEDWTTFVSGCLYRRDGRQCYGQRTAKAGSEIHLSEQDRLALDILAVEGDVWAHNGGRFDSLWLADRLAKLGVKFQLICAGSTIVCLRAGKTSVFDSFALTKQKLVDLTSGLDVQKQKLALPCRCGEACGGYCSIRTGKMPQSEWQKMIEYMVADCESLMLAMDRLQAFADENDLDLSSTTGGAAWKTIARWLELPKNDLDAYDWKFAREAYFGGRVFVGRSFAGQTGTRIRGIDGACQIDVNSMYPFALARGLFPVGPVVNPGGDRGATAQEHWNAGLPGIYQCMIQIPETHISPLPVRSANGRVCYPWGTFRGRWTRPEIEYALSLGATAQIERCVVWPKVASVYAPWAERIFKIRATAPGGKNGPLGIFCKFQANAPSGKLGSKAEHDTIFVNPENIKICVCTGACTEDRRLCPCRGKCSRGCLGACGAHVPLDPGERFFRRSTWRIDDCSRPHHAAYLTGLSRIKWHRQAVSVDQGRDVVYGDTDSLFCVKPRTIDLGSGLGEWSDKGAFRDMIVIAPKVYRVEQAGKIEVMAKGIRKGGASAKDIIPGPSGKTAALDSGQKIRGAKSGFRAGELFVKANISRQISWGTGDRISLRDGTTRAPHVSELELE